MCVYKEGRKVLERNYARLHSYLLLFVSTSVPVSRSISKDVLTTQYDSTHLVRRRTRVVRREGQDRADRVGGKVNR